MRHRPRASGICRPVEFFDNVSRYGGVSEAIAEREPAGEILTLSFAEGEGSPGWGRLPRFTVKANSGNEAPQANAEAFCGREGGEGRRHPEPPLPARQVERTMNKLPGCASRTITQISLLCSWM